MGGHDVVVIGGGPGGYVAAVAAAQAGLDAVLVEREALGGTCLNRGCVPTKSLLADAKLLHAARRSEALTGAAGLGLDLGRSMGRKDKVVKALVGGLKRLMASHGVTVVAGAGRLAGPGRVEVTAGGETRTLEARHVIVATGSRPALPPFAQVEGMVVQTSDEALADARTPGRVVVIGGGVVGVEFASLYRALGAETHVVEMLPDILAAEDADARKAVRLALTRQGARLHLSARVESVSVSGGEAAVTLDDPQSGRRTIAADRVLLAAGRWPNLDGLDPAALGLAMEGRFVKVDRNQATSLPGVWAVGDVAGGLMLAHKASAEGEAAVAAILGRRREVKPRLIPRVVWTMPELAAVGLGEAEARQAARTVKVGRFDYSGSGKALAMNEAEGFVKIVSDADTGELLGVHIVGEGAADLLGEPLLAMTMEAAVEDLAEVIKPHPTLSEMLREAALDCHGLAVHLPRRAR